ncbi:hypothetical protein BVH03_23010 [Pseudomonas sp. PA15(2017)]|uniref:hypothetical protein n=1 Tax=Pseudomonas sp. PA15(2017) TaxID=1932111 RepID=UPI00095E0F68|nr:hypothetical protein [Pseudomonas sp. PA15(2017)]OLU23101.1 hypothetical protein BVH03_23010 [Pseudomonas sp. PA15(2017)]
MSTSTEITGGPVRSLAAAIDLDCREFKGGHTAVCAILEEPYGPFQKRLSCSYPEHHLNTLQLARVVELTRGPMVREWFEQVFGVVTYQPKPVQASQDALKALSKLLDKEGKFVGSLVGGSADGKWEAHEVEVLEEHGYALIGKLLGIMAGAREAMEGRSHG